MLKYRVALLALAGLLIVLVALPSCGRRYDARRLRLGFVANLSNAPVMIGVQSGRYAAALARLGVQLEAHEFHAGPEAMESLLAGSLDVACVGPPPALNAFVHTGGRGVRVVGGTASGGASFVVRPGANIERPQDLHGRRIATPQFGNTQDLALRSYLREHGLRTTDEGGDVRVLPMANGDAYAQMRLGRLDGAWLPEPWASRLVVERIATRWIDERTLWPGGRFATSVMTASPAYLGIAARNVVALLAAQQREITRLTEDPRRAQRECNDALRVLLGRGLAPAVLAEAWTRVEFLTDTMESSLRENARRSHALGFLRGSDVSGLVQRLLPSTALAAQ